MGRHNGFKKFSGCYTCRMCSKRTRDVNREEGPSMLCARCYEKAGDENAVSDGTMTEEAFNAKWGTDEPKGGST